MNLKVLYRIWNTFNKKEKLKFLLLFVSFIVLSILQAAGVISILPFLHILTDPEILQKNDIFSRIVYFFEFETDQSALLFPTLIFISSTDC